MVLQEEVFKAFKRAAIRKGFIRHFTGTGKRTSRRSYHLSMDAKRGPKYQAYLKFRKEFQWKGQNLPNYPKYQFHIYNDFRVRRRKSEERKKIRMKKELKNVKTELKELKEKYNVI